MTRPGYRLEEVRFREQTTYPHRFACGDLAARAYAARHLPDGDSLGRWLLAAQHAGYLTGGALHYEIVGPADEGDETAPDPGVFVGSAYECNAVVPVDDDGWNQALDWRRIRIQITDDMRELAERWDADRPVIVPARTEMREVPIGDGPPWVPFGQMRDSE